MAQFILIVLIFAIGIVAIILWQRSQLQKKADNFKVLAQQTGWLLENNGRQTLYNQLSQFKVFQRGSWKDIRGVLAGQIEGTNFRVISFRHGSMTGVPTEYLILFIEDAIRSLPELAFRHKKAGFLFKNGATPPEFDAYPPLKQNYALQTEFPDEAMRLLRFDLLETFALAAQNIHLLEVEIAATQFLCYQRKKGEGAIKAETVQQLVQQGVQISRQL